MPPAMHQQLFRIECDPKEDSEGGHPKTFLCTPAPEEVSGDVVGLAPLVNLESLDLKHTQVRECGTEGVDM
eukprot:1091080-Amphidinium_carterae.1